MIYTEIACLALTGLAGYFLLTYFPRKINKKFGGAGKEFLGGVSY
jgi:hypothetical protein